jgi:acetyl esterase/lipase
VLLLLLVALFLGAVVFRAAVADQTRALAVLALVADVPLLVGLVEFATDEPSESDLLVAGVPTALFRPGGDGPWPTAVFVNGVTPRGREHPTVRRLASGLARSGYVVLVPDPPGLATGELTPRTLEATVAVVRAAAERPDALGARVALIGVSAGASLALLAAQDHVVGRRVAVVSGMAPYGDLRNVIRTATTGQALDGERAAPFRPAPFVALVTARSLAAGLPPGPDRRALLSELRDVRDDHPAPLQRFRDRRDRDLGADGRALVALLGNRDPHRFDRLFEGLPEPVRASTRELSPLHRAGLVTAPVELVSAPRDRYFPLSESRRIVRRAPDATLTVTATLEHADLRPSLRALGDLVRMNGYVVRTLRLARTGPPATAVAAEAAPGERGLASATLPRPRATPAIPR